MDNDGHKEMVRKMFTTTSKQQRHVEIIKQAIFKISDIYQTFEFWIVIYFYPNEPCYYIYMTAAKLFRKKSGSCALQQFIHLVSTAGKVQKYQN